MIGRYAAVAAPLATAMVRETVTVDGVQLQIPGSRAIRASVLLGNVRIRTLLDRLLRPGDTVVDVGANIGAITVWAARRVGQDGQVIAIEPAGDNLAVLRHNVQLNAMAQVRIVAGAAGRARETRSFYLRGGVSAVNSLFPESCYASVTGVTEVDVRPLDDLVPGRADLIKIDVEGAELEVLAGMPRLCGAPGVRLIIEWHPVLQRAAGCDPEALPRRLLDDGFLLEAVGHLRREPLRASDVPRLCERLTAAKRPVELLASRPVAE